MKLQPPSAFRSYRTLKMLAALVVAGAAGAAGHGAAGKIHKANAPAPALAAAANAAKDTAGVLVPVAGAKTGSYEEVSRIITRKQWQVLNKAQRGMIRGMLIDARTGSAPFDACFAPGTQPEIVRAFEGAENSLSAFRIGGMWSQTVTNPSLSRGQAVTLTWSIVPDGTVFSTGDGSGSSNLQAWATTTYGSVEAFRIHMRAVFNEYEHVTGVRYVEISADDGVSIPNNAGVVGVRGDIRIGGRNIDGTNNVLAYNYFPNSGDMVIDTADAFYDADRDNASTPLRGFINVLTHEHGHGLGLDHVCPVNQTKLMEPFVSYAFQGAQPDDIAAVQRNYGDTFESPSGNDTTAAATDLGTLTVGTTSRTNLSIDGSDDVDVFRFGKDIANRTATITVTPLGSPYLEGPQADTGACSAGTTFDPRNQRNLIVELLDGSGHLMARADNTPAGSAETIPVTGLTSSTSHYVRVSGSGADALQMYSIDITLGTRVNVAPSVVVSLSPTTATSTSVLTATITKSDPEGNPMLQSIRWLADGVVIAGQTGTTLNLASIATIEPGDVITVEVTEDDGNGAVGRGAATVQLQESAGLVVTTLADVVAADGQNSLREAYAYAMTQPASPVPVITFKAGVTGTLILGSALPQLSRAVSISGPGSGVLALSGGSTTRFLQIASGGALQVSGLTFKEFVPDFTDLEGYGGVFYMTGGSLTANSCVFRNNEAFNAGGVVFVPDTGAAAALSFTDTAITDNAAWYGGALSLEMAGSTLQMTRCSVTGNDSLIDTGNPSAPGAIYAVNVPMTLTGTTFTNNTGPAGGAIYFIDNTTTNQANINSCTFSGNSATATGGNGGAIRDSSDILNVRNSTFSDNDAVGNGGAIWDFGGNSRYANCTFSNNSAANGFDLDMEQSTATLINNIFNRGAIGGSAPLLFVTAGSYSSAGNNLFSDLSPANFTKLASDKSGVNPLLGALADNGGQVLTMAPGTTSPAVDAGSDAVLAGSDNLATDARGAGFPRKVGSSVDIGAFERGITDTANPTVTFTAPASGASVTTLSAVTGTATDDVSVNTVTFRLQRISDSQYWTGTAWGNATELTTSLTGAVTSRTWGRTSGLPAGADLTTGGYVLIATATDSANKTGTATRSFSISAGNSAPSVAFTEPASGASLTSLPAVSGTATDDVSVASVTFRLQRASDSTFWTGSTWGASTELATALTGAVTSRTWSRPSGLPTGANLAPGSYTLTATATDSATLTGTATRNFTVPSPNSPPTVAFASPAAGASLTSLAAVTGTATDDVTVSTVTLRLQRASDNLFWTGSAWGASTELTTTLAGAVTSRSWSRTSGLPTGSNLAPGSYTLAATATDNAAQTGTATRNFTVPVPNAPPTVAFTAPASGASLTSLPAVTGTATDDVSVTSVTLRLQRASDSLFWTGSAWGASTELTTTLGGTVTSRTWGRTSGLPAGTALISTSYTLTATAKDGSNATATATRSFTVPPSNTPPTVAFIAPASGASLTSLPAINGTATDNVSVSSVTLRLQRGSDSKFWTGVAWGASTELTTTLGGTVTNRNWLRNSDLPVGADLAPGSYTLTATAKDGAAAAGTASEGFTVVTPAAPTVAFSAPASGATLNSLGTVSGTATDAIGLSAVTFRLQRASDNLFWTGSAWGATTELATTSAGTATNQTWSRSADLPAGTDLVAGNYTLTATAINNFAITATASRGFTVSAPTAPTVAFTSPASGASLTTIPDVSGTAADAVAISTVTFRLQRASDSKFWTGIAWGASTELATTLGGTPASRTWTRTTDLPFGANLLSDSYTLTVTATNISALTAIATRGFTVPVPTATTAVVATVTTPVTGSTVKTLSIANGTVVDQIGGPGISKVEVTLQRVSDSKFWNGTTWDALSTPLAAIRSGNVWSKGGFPAAGTDPNTQLLEGQYVLSAIATNINGVKSAVTAASKSQFTVDRTAPASVVITTPGEGTTKTLANFTGTATDNIKVSKVVLILKRGADAKFWTGTNWGASTELPTNLSGLATARTWGLSTGLPTGENLNLGSYAVTAIAIDAAGSRTSALRSFTLIDGKLPTATIGSPINGSVVSSLSAIYGTAGDTGGSFLSTVKITLQRTSDLAYWTGTVWSPTSTFLPPQITTVTRTTANWRCTAMPHNADLVDGAYRATAMAVDRAGNNSAVVTVQFTLRTAAAISAPAIKSSDVMLSSAYATTDGTIQLIFTGALGSSATDVSHYSATQNGTPMEIFSAQLKSPSVVVLTTGELTAGARVAVTYDLQDTGGGGLAGAANAVVK